MRAHENIYRAFRELLQNFPRAFFGFQACEALRFDSGISHPFFEKLGVLVREHGGGSEERHLFSRQGHPESGSERHFGFSEADVPDQKPFHGCVFGKIFENFLQRPGLAFRLDVVKFIPDFFFEGVRKIRRPGRPRAFFVKLQKFGREFHDVLTGFFLGLNPKRRAETRNLRVFKPEIRRDFLAHTLRHQEPVGLSVFSRRGIFHYEIIFFHAPENPDAVVFMYHVVSGFKFMP